MIQGRCTYLVLTSMCIYWLVMAYSPQVLRLRLQHKSAYIRGLSRRQGYLPEGRILYVTPRHTTVSPIIALSQIGKANASLHIHATKKSQNSPDCKPSPLSDFITFKSTINHETWCTMKNKTGGIPKRVWNAQLARMPRRRDSVSGSTSVAASTILLLTRIHLTLRAIYAPTSTGPRQSSARSRVIRCRRESWCMIPCAIMLSSGRNGAYPAIP